MTILKNSALIFASVFGLNCPEPIIENRCNDFWNAKDQANYERAITRCGEKFENSPCLKRFIKRDVLTYWIICGKGTK